MKTTYECEVCGKEFADWEECSKHEKTCKEIHATGLRLTGQINDTVKTAQECGNCGVGICAGTDNIYRLAGAEYDAKERLVVLNIDTDDNIAKRKGGAHNGND